MPDTRGRRGSFYREIFFFLSGIRSFLLLAMTAFVIGGVIGWLSPSVGARLVDAFSEYVRTLQGQSLPELILAIFFKNLTAAAIGIFAGFFFGVFPLVAAGINGMLAGVFISMDPLAAWKILPHGIFELPAVFLAWGMGIWCGTWILEQDKWRGVRRRVEGSLRVLVGVIIPLLALAALVEGVAAVYLHGF